MRAGTKDSNGLAIRSLFLQSYRDLFMHQQLNAQIQVWSKLLVTPAFVRRLALSLRFILQITQVTLLSMCTVKSFRIATTACIKISYCFWNVKHKSTHNPTDKASTCSNKKLTGICLRWDLDQAPAFSYETKSKSRFNIWLSENSVNYLAQFKHKARVIFSVQHHFQDTKSSPSLTPA